MAKNQSTYTLKIDAELGNLQKTLNEAKNSLASFMQSGKAPKGLEKAFEKINDLLGQISDKTGKPLDFKGLTATGKDLDKVQESFRSIIRLLGDFDDLSDDIKLSFLGPEEQKKISDAANALKNYGTAAEEAAKKVKALETAQKAMSKDKTTLEKAQKKVSDLNNDKTQTSARLRGAQGKLAAAQGMEKVNPKDVAKYAAEVEKLTADLQVLDNQLAAANEEVTRAQSAYNVSAKSVKALENQAKQASSGALKALKNEASALGISLDGLNGHDAAKQVEILTNRLEEFKSEVMSGARPAFNQITAGCNKAEQAAQGLQGEILEAAETTKQMDEALANQQAFENKIKQFLGLQGAAQVMRAALRDAMATITELDATMTEMAVVTDLTVGDYWDQLPEYSQRASELGVSINSAYKAATLYYQQGLKTNEVVALSNETLKMAKIAGIDAAEATDKMTAALRGFNMELNEASAQKISDVYSELAAITAADVDEISTAMTKTASIASSAGMEFETTAAFLAQIVETTRESAETAGTAMKTVIARFQELKKDPSEIGEVDGEIVDANAIETALRSVGVSLRDASGQFRALDEVFLELSSKWNTLDKNTQRYIATIAAGSRQQSRFIAMMQDYGRTQELVTAANNSAGASQEQFGKTMDSLEAKVEKLKNAWHEFTMGIMNSDLVKFGVDVLTKFLEIVNKATSGLDGIGGSLVKIISVLGVFKLGSKIFNKFREPIIKLFADIVKEAGIAGEKSGQAYKENLEKVKNQPTDGLKEGYYKDKSGKVHCANGEFARAGEGIQEVKSRSGMQKLGDKTIGLNHFEDAWNNSKVTKAEKAALTSMTKEGGDLKQRRQALDQAKGGLQFAQAAGDKAEIDSAAREVEKAQVALQDYEAQQEKVKASSASTWNSIGQGISDVGQGLQNTGMILSMIGGIMSSLGLEEFGEALAGVGQVITLIGTALMAIPPILTLITAHPIIALITLIIGVILGSIIAIVSYINGISADAKLKKAQENAKAAEEAAKATKEAYDELNNSINELDDKYDALDGLVKGTEEWNKAVQDVNDSVLDLIAKYPELAGFVENDGGLLTIDLDSAEVQNVLKDYESSAVLAKGQEIAAKKKVNEAELTKNFSELGAIDQVATQRGWNAFGEATAIGTQAGIATSAGNPIVAAAGALTGAITGATVGAITGPIAAAETKTDKALQEATENLANAVYGKEIEANAQQMEQYLISQGVVASEAQIMAEAFANDTKALMDFGAAVAETTATEKAYYAAMTENAKQLMNMSQFSAEDQSQMSNIMDKDLLTLYEKQAEEQFSNLGKEGWASAKEDYVKDTFGAGARIDGNKVVDEQGNTLREFSGDEAWYDAIVASEVTKKAAESMEKIPELLDKISAEFEGKIENASDLINKAFSDGADAMTKAEIEAFSKITEGEDLRQYYNDHQDNLVEIYGSFEEFEKSFTDIAKTGKDQFEKATIAARDLGIELNQALTAAAAQGWTQNLTKIASAGGDIGAMDAAFDAMGLSAEDTEKAMSQINAIDWSDSNAWENLKQTFDELNIAVADASLDNFIQQAIETSRAVDKINFDNFNKQLNDTYNLLEKMKSGNRKYSEEDYKAIVASNKSFESKFMQVGDEFVYVGGTMEELKEAIREDSSARLQEANARLSQLSEIANFMDNRESKAVSSYNENELRLYLNEVRNAMSAQGLDLANIGEVGLSNQTSFFSESLTKDDLLRMAEAIEAQRGKKLIYDNDYAENMRQANITVYAQDNTAAYNAEMAAGTTEYADEHQQALLLQAIQSGGVSNALIESYQRAVASGDRDEIRDIGKQIAAAADKVIEASEGRDQYSELIDRVTDSIADNRQKEIDKLGQINDSVNNAQSNLVSKLQEQINNDRQKREEEKAKENISNLQNQAAYLAMDTSGANSLSLLNTEQQIAEAEQSYQDMLVDQAIQNLQDANEKAAQQREQQIALLQAQLDADLENGKIAQEADLIVRDSLTSWGEGVPLNETQMYSILFGSEGGSLSAIAQEDWASSLQTMATTATNWLTQPDESTNVTGDTGDTSDGGGTSGSSYTPTEEDKHGQAIAEYKQAITKFAKGQATQDQVNDAKANLQDYYEMRDMNESHDFRRVVSQANIEAMQETGRWIGPKIHAGSSHQYADKTWELDLEEGKYGLSDWLHNVRLVPAANSDDLNRKFGTPTDNNFVVDNDKWYAAWQGGWYTMSRTNNPGADQNYDNGVILDYLERLNPDNSSKIRFKTGGLADFTGPAWLDGTPSKPEYVLNAVQTEKFFSLIDVLENYDTDKNGQSTSGDNYFDINISVEKIDDDYDVEKMADKIRRMIYEDATYRNVNTINHIR